ncbi:hypothetical protein FQA39_LY15823 [Lamprigera yunnana]|nr:hypothetical protein FQA39_LY15823 [Lamprigera yunnana]
MNVYIIVVICALTGVETVDTNKDIYIFRSCSKKYNLSITNVDHYYHSLITCMKDSYLYSECYFRGMGYIDNNGSIIYSNLKKTHYYLYSLQQSGDIIDQCSPTNENTVGEKVSILMKCTLKTMMNTWQFYYNYYRIPRQQWAIRICAKRNNLPVFKLEEYFKILPANGQMIQMISECYLLELNYLNIKGNLLLYQFKNRHTIRFPRVSFNTLIDQCSSYRGTTVAETSYKFLNCLFNETKLEQQQQLEIQQCAIVVCGKKYQLPIRNLQDYIDVASKYDYQLQLYSKCYLTELEYIDRTGRIQYDHIKNIRTPYIFRKQYSNFVDLCKNDEDDNINKTSHKFVKCFLFNIYKVYTKTSSNLSHTQGHQGTDPDQRQIEYVQQQLEKKHVQLDQFRQLVKQHEEAIDLLQYQLSQLQRLPKATKEQYKLLEQQDQLQTDFERKLQEQKEKFQHTLQQIQKNNQQLQQQLQKNEAQYESFEQILHKQQNIQFKKLGQALIARSPKVKLFSECYLRELGYLDKTGAILYEKVKKTSVDSISTEQYSEIVGICKSLLKNQVAEIPYKFSRCVLLSINKIYEKQQLDLQLRPEQKQLAHLKICAERYNLEIRNFQNYSRMFDQRGLRELLFSECYLRGIACLNRNNTIIYEKVKMFTPPGVSHKVYSNFVEFCKGAKAQGTVDLSYTFLKCLQNCTHSRTITEAVKKNSTQQTTSHNKTDEEVDKEQEKQPQGTQSLDVDT